MSGKDVLLEHSLYEFHKNKSKMVVNQKSISVFAKRGTSRAIKMQRDIKKT